MGGENGLHLPNFDPVAADLHQAIGTTEDLDGAIGEETGAVAGGEEAGAGRGIERMRDELCAGGLGVVQIARGDLSADVQFTRDTDGAETALRIEYINLHAGGGAAGVDEEGIVLGSTGAGETGAGLGGAVVDEQAAVGPEFEKAAFERGREDFADAEDRFQGIGVEEVIEAEEHLESAGREEGPGDVVATDESGQARQVLFLAFRDDVDRHAPGGVEGFGDGEGGAGIGFEQEPVRGLVGGRGPEIAERLDDEFGKARGTGGEVKDRRVGRQRMVIRGGVGTVRHHRLEVLDEQSVATAVGGFRHRGAGGDHDGGAGELEKLGKAGGRAFGIEQEERAAGLVDRAGGDDEVDGALENNGDHDLGAHAPGLEIMAELIGAPIEFGKRDFARAVDHGCGVGAIPGGTLKALVGEIRLPGGGRSPTPSPERGLLLRGDKLEVCEGGGGSAGDGDEELTVVGGEPTDARGLKVQTVVVDPDPGRVGVSYDVEVEQVVVGIQVARPETKADREQVPGTVRVADRGIQDGAPGGVGAMGEGRKAPQALAHLAEQAGESDRRIQRGPDRREGRFRFGREVGGILGGAGVKAKSNHEIDVAGVAPEQDLVGGQQEFRKGDALLEREGTQSREQVVPKEIFVDGELGRGGPGWLAVAGQGGVGVSAEESLAPAGFGALVREGGHGTEVDRARPGLEPAAGLGQAGLEMSGQGGDVGRVEHGIMISRDILDDEVAGAEPGPTSGAGAGIQPLRAPEQVQASPVIGGGLIASGRGEQPEVDVMEADELVERHRVGERTAAHEPFEDLRECGDESRAPCPFDAGLERGLRDAVGGEEVGELSFRRVARGRGFGGGRGGIQEGEERDGLAFGLELAGHLEGDDAAEGPATEQVGAVVLDRADGLAVERSKFLDGTSSGLGRGMEVRVFDAGQGFAGVHEVGEREVGEDLTAAGMDAEEGGGTRRFPEGDEEALGGGGVVRWGEGFGAGAERRMSEDQGDGGAEAESGL